MTITDHVSLDFAKFQLKKKTGFKVGHLGFEDLFKGKISVIQKQICFFNNDFIYCKYFFIDGV